MQKTDNLQKRYAIYCRVLTAGLLIIFITFLPYLADYYILQPSDTVLDYFSQNSVNRYYSFETVIVMLAVASVWCISGRVGIALFIPSMLFLLLSYAGSIKYAALNELFRLSDLRLVEAAGIATRYLSLKFTSTQIMIAVTILLLCACGFVSDRFCRKYPLFQKKEEKYQRKIYVLRIFCGFVCLAAMFRYGGHFIRSEYSMEFIDSASVTNTRNDRYILYNFLKNDNLADIDIAHAENSYRFFLDNPAVNDCVTESGRFPNVIVIMNESWWNTDNISGNSVTFSSDPMESYHRLAENCSAGELSTNIFCGGTIGSETEFLTGLNIKYCNSFMGIATEIQEHKVPSIVDYFNALDYDTIAIHPYDGRFYGRNRIYHSLGFDKTIFEKDMFYTDTYSCYISDESLARQIIKECEENRGTQKFIYAVSIGNHIRGLDAEHIFNENYPYPISVTLDGDLEQEAYTDLVNYINGIYLANEAFAQLVFYFEQQEEPTVLVMYGDHMPGFSKEVLTLLQLDGTDSENQRHQYAVPVLMWSNFETDRVAFDGENIGYLSQMLLEYANLPESDMTRILKYQREIFKTNTGNIVIDCLGHPIESYNEEQIEAIRHFKVVSYDILHGSSPLRDRVWQPYD
ncbi:MAG: sulfatase-like hydrolase/transferase [Lachnospiraceae bacterium]|nr:sulfatase-like hydrolase/transferase [Lachnospiraceae bacterium]